LFDRVVDTAAQAVCAPLEAPVDDRCTDLTHVVHNNPETKESVPHRPISTVIPAKYRLSEIRTETRQRLCHEQLRRQRHKPAGAAFAGVH